MSDHSNSSIDPDDSTRHRSPPEDALSLLREVWGDCNPSITPNIQVGETPSNRDQLSTVKVPEQIGRFRILRKLGEGGFGVVFLAEDPSLQRAVALKVARPEYLFDDPARERFLREARLAASLNHPHIVTVHEVGEEGLLLYIAAEFCDGPDLGVWLRGRADLISARFTAELSLRIAEAVHHAHQQGIIHRDLKPSNVLLTGSSLSLESLPSSVTVKLTDFGLAKLQDDHPDGTRSGGIVGTPSYMAPEQATGRNREIGPTIDVYALGAILYELLTGRPPFQAETPLDTLRLVTDTEPVALHRLNPTVPQDLETICLKCLEKSPGKRYPSAQELADDLRRFLAGRPIIARPAGPLERGWRWCQRNPWAALLIVALILGAGGSTFFAVRAAAHAADANESARLAEERRLLAERRERERYHQWDRAERLLYAQLLPAALRHWRNASAPAAFESLDATPKRLRGWEYRFLDHLFHRLGQRTLGSHDPAAWGVAYSPDGRIVASAGEDGRVHVWEIVTGRELWTAGDDTGSFRCMAISPDGEHLAVGGAGGTVRFWNLHSGEEIGRLIFDVKTLVCLEFSANGRRAIVVGDNQIWQWDPSSMQRPQRVHLKGEGPNAVLNARLSPDGRRVVFAHRDTTARVWDLDGGGEVCRTDPHPGGVYSVAFSPDGASISTGGIVSKIHMWEVETGRLLKTSADLHQAIIDLDFSPDGRRIVAGLDDGVIKVCDVESGEVSFRFVGHVGAASRVRFSPDGQSIMSAGRGGAVKVWDVVRGQDPMVVALPRGKGLGRLALNSDGTLVVVGGGDVTLRDTESGKVLRSYDGGGRIRGVAISPDGAEIAAGGDRGVVHVWATQDSGSESRLLTGHEGAVEGLVYSPQGTRLASASQDGTARVWDPRTGSPVYVYRGHGQAVISVAFSPDGSRVASAGRDGTVRVWDTETGGNEVVCRGHDGSVYTVDFSPDGEWVVSGGEDRMVRIWDAHTGEPRQTLRGHGQGIWTVVVADAGKRIISGGEGNVLIWDITSGRKLMALPMGEWEPKWVYDLALSANGARLAAVAIGTDEGQTALRLQLWDATPPDTGPTK